MTARLEIVFPDGSTEPVPDWSLRYDERCAAYPDRDCPGCHRWCARTGDFVFFRRTLIRKEKNGHEEVRQHQEEEEEGQ